MPPVLPPRGLWARALAKAAAVAAALLVGPAAVLQAQSPWVELQRAHLPTSVMPFTGALADIDGDGDLDYVHIFGVTLNVWINDGGGRFQPQPTATSLPSGPLIVRAGDVDADGDIDLAVDGSVVLNAAGALTPMAVGWGMVRLCADFTGDGRADVLSSNGLHRSLGTGAFTSIAVPPVPLAGDAVAADFDGDGDLDLLFGVPTTPQTTGFEQVWRNDGLGNFTDVSSSWWPNPAADATYFAAAGDLDGDGDVDSATGDFDGNWKLRRNDGTGVLQPWVTLTTAPSDAARFLADLDGDGDLDLPGMSGWLRNDGGGVFVRVVIRQPAQGRLHDVGDLNGDGKPDLIGTTDDATARPRLCLNRLPLPFADAAGPGGIPLFDREHEAVVGDCDGDGDPDFVRAVGPLYRNDGSGWTEPIDHGWAAPFAPALFADVDGDGDEDVVGHEPGPQLRVQRYVANGSWTPGPAMTIPGEVLLAFDADGDGDRDLLLPAVRLLRNDGTGTFVLDPAAPAGSLPCTRAAVADFDGDGDLDVLAADTQLNMFVNDGTGAFTWAPSRLGVITGQTQPASILPFDADGDSDIDVFVTQDGVLGNRILLLRNVGGVLVDAGGSMPGFGKALAAAGDFDADGDVDLAVAPNVPPFGIRDWRNDGTGLMTDVGPIGAATGELPALADIDGDGDLDVVAGDRIFVNRHWHAAAPYLPNRGHDYVVEFGGIAMPFGVAAPMLGARARWPLPPFGTVGIDLGSAVPLPLTTVTFSSGTLSIGVPPSAALVGQQFGVQAVLLDGVGYHLTPVVYDTVL